MNYGRFLSTGSYSSSDKNDGFIVSQSCNKALKKGCFKMCIHGKLIYECPLYP